MTKRTHKEDVHTQNKITHTNTHKNQIFKGDKKSKCDNKTKPQIFNFQILTNQRTKFNLTPVIKMKPTKSKSAPVPVGGSMKKTTGMDA
jgi:hypothetical protein